MSPLDELKELAQSQGLVEPICKNCSWFDAPKGDDSFGQCRQRRGDRQFMFGICLRWTSGKPDVRLIERDRSVVTGARSLFPGAEPPPRDRPRPTYEIKTLACAEPECGALLELRWSPRLQTFFYGCARYPTCNGTLPANEDGSPRGQPRTRELQGWRTKAHAAFDQIWQNAHAKRPDAYSWLRAATGLDHDSAHMGKMTIEQCKMVILVVQTKGPGTEFWEQWKSDRKLRKAEKAKSKRRSRRTSTRGRSTTP